MAIIDRLLGLNEKPVELDNPYEYDCPSCRAVGVYTYSSGMKQIRLRQNFIEKSKSRYKTGSRQLGIISLSASLIGLGIYRLYN